MVMWQAENDRYTLWRLEQEMGVKPIDRLLNSVTVSDRAEGTPLIGLDLKPVAAGLGRSLKRLCSWIAMRPIVPQGSE
jgi:hypothetical protein